MKDLSRRRKLHRRIRVGLALFWTVAVGVMFWNMQAKGVGESVLQSDGSVRVTRSEGLIRFDPVAAPAGAALLFYPGALVDPVAYAPMARAVAANGLQVVIQELPFRIAPLDGHKREVSERSVALMRAQPELSWVIGGHSRGAVLATFVRRRT